MPFTLMSFSKSIDRKDFCCGTPELDKYFVEQLGQDEGRDATRAYLLLSNHAVAGFFTLSAGAVELTRLPPTLLKQVARYAQLPAAVIGRLAVDQRFKGQGLGGLLLAEALGMAVAGPLAVTVALVDAKDEGAAAFYRKYGFVSLPDVSPLKLFMTAKGARRAIEASTRS
ncbi:GNAT family N-acetyltransferase [Bordetella genomosp. 5]|uniref:GNAT family N-acetyltransferase n=1 Tax=Bordetella genomosp. 5 TaxID=1395608 RepID=UPI000B9E6F31|nr:GNAT family N-acetyltransferase [Bordetella genomosp. 5]OZI33407.1 GNAT family N-acetyltransferase [Bordetella genomosp. 5]